MRKTELLKTGFKFKKFALGEVFDGVFSPDFDDGEWREVTVPHDWGVEGVFAPENDAHSTCIIQDGMTKPVLHTGRSGALPTVGEGVYRKWVTLGEAESVALELDGVMWQSHIYVNGKRAGGCHYGYLSFEVDITDYVHVGENLIAVHAVLPPDCSRWYPGAGLYRNVRLVTRPKAHIAYSGIWVRPLSVTHSEAQLALCVDAVGATGFYARITDPEGKTVYEGKTDGERMLVRIESPMLWDIGSPRLYNACVTLEGGDTVSVPFGVRSTAFTEDGFFLNGRYTKIKGVCLHHDAGCIGAAVNPSALTRQIELLKGMGINAIRTSHNPPAPELLTLCDEHGILVIDEFFDEWAEAKVKNGYHTSFEKHALSDIESIVRRDRNHPSVIMWSIGNEIGEQRYASGKALGEMLSRKTKEVDPTRPTTAGFDAYPDCFTHGLAFCVDVVGLNYKPHFYKETKEKYPNVLLYGSETASCISTRGVYTLPAKIDIGEPKNDALTVSDYGLSAPAWAYYAERELCAQEDFPFVMGEFVWTGFDYMGEPTPYYTEWPARSSYFGVFDLAGFPKNRYYGYRAAWTDTPTLHIFPHWSWEGHEGEVIPVHVYTNFDEVELFVNGVSSGKRTRLTEGSDPESQVKRFRLVWEDTVYMPGELCAVAYRDGKEAAREVVRTAGEAHHIVLSAYRESISADGESLNYVSAAVVDKDGNLCPHASDRLCFTAEGAADVIATDAGDQRETEAFRRPDKKALSGRLLCVLRSNGKVGKTTVTCTAEGLLSAEISFACI